MNRNGCPARSYAVTWRDGTDAVRAGKLELDSTGVYLEGGAPGRRLAARRLPFADISSLRWAGGEERLGRAPTLVLERRHGPPVLVAGIGSAGALREVFDRLAPAAGAVP